MWLQEKTRFTIHFIDSFHLPDETGNPADSGATSLHFAAREGKYEYFWDAFQFIPLTYFFCQVMLTRSNIYSNIRRTTEPMLMLKTTLDWLLLIMLSILVIMNTNNLKEMYKPIHSFPFQAKKQWFNISFTTEPSLILKPTMDGQR